MRKLMLSMDNSRIELNEIEKHNDPEEVAKLFMDLNYEDNSSQISMYPRSSGLYNSCMRQSVLCYKEKISFDRYLSASMKVTFEIGNSFHHWVQNTPRLLGNNRRGKWRCSSCRHLSIFGPPPVHNCPTCGALSSAYQYEETEIFMISPFYLSGHPDMFIERPKGNFRLMEIKSINSKGFNSLQSPLPEHVWQIHSYILACVHDAMNVSVNIDRDIGYITYISKGYESRVFPIKTFVVRRDPLIMSAIKDKLETFRAGIDDGIYPEPIQQCVASQYMSYTSKSCPVVNICKDIQ